MLNVAGGKEKLTEGPKRVGSISLPLEAKMPETMATAKARKYRGLVFIDWNRCKGCGFCVEFCPPHVLRISEEFNTHGYHPPYLTNEAGCTGCDLCGLYCPDFAIFGAREPVVAVAQEVGSGTS